MGRVDAWPGDALDDYWAVTLQLSDFGHERLLGPPSLVRSVRRVWVQPPTDYTGTWVTWHVNGQKASENQYANGRYDGTCVGFYNDGSRYIVQHFMDHVCDGPETGHCRSGKKLRDGRYQRGKRVGTWPWWSENGQVTSVQEHEAGQPADPAKAAPGP